MLRIISRRKYEAEVAKRIADACDQIMLEIGVNLHDDLGHHLSFLRQRFDLLQRSSAAITEIRPLVVEMKTDFEMVMLAMNRISRGLQPMTNLESDTLISMLKMLCALEHPGTGHIHFTTEGESMTMDRHIELNILRIVQELIQNSFKHSSAWHVWVRLQWIPGKLKVEVEDDGTGISNIPEFIDQLKKKYNTLKIRTQAINANLEYMQGKKGLLTKIELPTKLRRL